MVRWRQWLVGPRSLGESAAAAGQYGHSGLASWLSWTQSTHPHRRRRRRRRLFADSYSNIAGRSCRHRPASEAVAVRPTAARAARSNTGHYRDGRQPGGMEFDPASQLVAQVDLPAQNKGENSVFNYGGVGQKGIRQGEGLSGMVAVWPEMICTKVGWCSSCWYGQGCSVLRFGWISHSPVTCTKSWFYFYLLTWLASVMVMQHAYLYCIIIQYQ